MKMKMKMKMKEFENDYNPRPESNAISFISRCRKIAESCIREHFPEADLKRSTWVPSLEGRYIKLFINSGDEGRQPDGIVWLKGAKKA